MYFSQFALPLQRNDRVHPTATSAAMAKERVCLCTDILQQQSVEAGILLAHAGGVCLVLSGFEWKRIVSIRRNAIARLHLGKSLSMVVTR